MTTNKINSSSSPPRERPLTAAFLDPMSHPVQAILVPTEHHQELGRLVREHGVSSFTATVPSVSRQIPHRPLVSGLSDD